MIRLFLSLTACFSAAALIAEVPLTGWAQLDSRGALRIVNRLDYTVDNFSGNAPGKADDRVVLDFMDFAGNSAFHPAVKRDGNVVTFAGPVLLGKEKAAFDLAGKAVVLSPERLSYEIALSSAEPCTLKEAFFSLRYERSMLDRELLFTLQAGEKRYVHKVKVPAAHRGGWIWSSPKGQQVVGVAIPKASATCCIVWRQVAHRYSGSRLKSGDWIRLSISCWTAPAPWHISSRQPVRHAMS